MRQSSELNPDLIAPPRLPLPRLSLRLKALLIVTSLVFSPMIAASYLMFDQARKTAAEAFRIQSAEIADAHLKKLSEFGLNHPHEVADEFEAITDQAGVAFAVLLDRTSRISHQIINDPRAWGHYQSRHPDLFEAPASDHLELLPDGNPLSVAVRKIIVTTADNADPRRGKLILGLVDRHAYPLLAELRRSMVLILAGLYALFMPLILIWVQQLVNPLRRLLGATLQLGVGSRFEPVQIDRRDEIGQLGLAFNTMAVNLSAIQQALLQSNQSLEHKVARRTAELQQTNQRLRSEMAEKDQFLRAISHDLGAPLRNITGLASLLQLKHRAEVGDAAMDKIERIIANAKVETDLLNDLLDLSRIKSRPGKISEVDLNELARQSAASLGYEMEQARIRFVIDTPLPRVRADRIRLRQVFQNLIDNAIKYMPPAAEHPVREIHVGWAAQRGRRVFYVRDTGAGIDPADQQEIFQLFRRGRHNRRAEIPGKGVGLATVKAILETYGGDIWIQSSPPEGAAFYFTLDRQHILDPAPNSTERQAS